MQQNMNWHYVNAGQAAGPVSDAQLDELVQTGAIKAETLVWNETMTEWQPYSRVKPADAKAPPRLVMAGVGGSESSAAEGLESPPAAATVQACSQCGKVLPAENLILLGGALVCAACKPLSVQKMRAGLPPAGGGPMEYAGVGTRLAAKLLDALILGFGAALIIGVAAAVLIPLIARNRNQSGIFVVMLVLVIATVVFGLWFYQIWCLPKYGGTPGKRILNIKVVTADGGPISWGRSFGRFFAEMLNGFIPLWIGYLIAIFDAQKRTVHDHIAGTRVVKRW